MEQGRSYREGLHNF